MVESVATWPTHPVGRLRRAGVSPSINTDTRMLAPTTLTREYELMREYFGWTSDTLLATNIAALRHAFVDDAMKETLLSRLIRAWGRDRAGMGWVSHCGRAGYFTG
jgi:adenosine deaminase